MMRFDTIWIFTPAELKEMPPYTELVSISGRKYILGVDEMFLDQIYGHSAYGVTDISNHPLSELFTCFMLRS